MVNNINGMSMPILENQLKSNKKEENSVFEDFYNAAIGLLDETNKLELEADEKVLDFAMGKTGSIEDVLIAQEKANILLQFTIQVRNKAVESYKEIMRMPL